MLQAGNLLLLGAALCVYAGAHLAYEPDAPTKELPGTVVDVLHDATAGYNAYLNDDLPLTNVLLFSTSLCIQVAAIALVVLGLLGSTFRPLLGTLVATLFRQFFCVAIELPVPKNILWYKPYPNIPELVFYDVQNDLYYSGHVGIVAAFMLEMAFRKQKGLELAGFLMLVFQWANMTILRVHYTIDLLDGFLSIYVFMKLADHFSPAVDALIFRAVKATKERVGISSNLLLVAACRVLFVAVVGVFWAVGQVFIGSRGHKSMVVDHSHDILSPLATTLLRAQSVALASVAVVCVLGVALVTVVFVRSSKREGLCPHLTFPAVLLLRMVGAVSTRLPPTEHALALWNNPTLQSLHPAASEAARLVLPLLPCFLFYAAFEAHARGDEATFGAVRRLVATLVLLTQALALTYVIDVCSCLYSAAAVALLVYRPAKKDQLKMA